MGNVLHVLKRDILRLLRVPQALVVVLALLVLPSLYTWYNVLGFWNPYENTGELRVCVVNQDAGAESELTGRIDVGQMIVDELHGNDQLDWQFPGYDEAMDQLNAGECYAVFVIPEGFSADLLTITTGSFQQPDIEYYVNEKIGPVSPKITDTGANTLDATVNAAFVQTVSQKAAEALDAAVQESRDEVGAAQSEAAARIGEAKGRVQEALDSLDALTQRASEAKEGAAAAQTTLSQASEEVGRAVDALDALTDLSATVQGDYLAFSASAAPAAAEAMKAAADAYAEAARLLAQAPVQDEQMKELLAQLRASADKAQADADRYSDALVDDVAPALGEGLGDLAAASAAAGGTASAQKALLGQAVAMLGDMASTLDGAQTALAQTRELLVGLLAELDRVQTDVLALSGSGALAELLGEDGLDASRVAAFIGAPTDLVTEQLYPLNSYGSAMAPLFMNLTFWIGAFMLMVILRQEVDSEGIRRLTLTQRYVGRYLLFALFVVLQAAICCAGLPLIGVAVVNLPALFFAAIVASLSYLSIIYALSVTLQHIGKGICIVLVFAQIPGATGLYPIEMTSPFFQAIYPLLPFTYGISAMRESICGFYGAHYAADIGILLAYLAAFMAAGIVVRPLMSNVNRMVARQIKRSGIFNGEDVEVPVRRFRASQVIRVLADREEYRAALVRRYERFQRMYPRLIRGAVVVGVAVPVAAALVCSFGTTGKVVLLTLWLGWIVAVFVFLVVVESLRSSFERQMRLDGMSDDEIRELYLMCEGTESADVVHGAPADALADAGEQGGEVHA